MKEKILDWMKKYKEETSCNGVVLGLSGGKDSTVVAMLSKLMFGDNVYALIMPNGDQKDIDDAIQIAEKLKLNYKIVNIETIYNSLILNVENIISDGEWKENCPKLTEKSKTNIPPRIRMTVLYAVAQTLGYRVIGTSNLSERYIGWSTKFGDSACDFNPIGELTCTEVVKLGCELAKEFELSEDFIKKVPQDGLTGKSDEDNFGFTYAQLDSFIRTGYANTTHQISMEEFVSGKSELERKFEMLHEISKHKRNTPYIPKF